MVTVTTADELLALPRGRHRYELVRGELRTMSPAGHNHGGVAARLIECLSPFIRRHKLGRLYGAETGFLLEHGPDTVLAPDVAFVRKERLDAVPARDFFPGPPDLAGEVRSPDDSVRELRAKAQSWLAHGCRLVFTVDPEARTMTVYRPGAEPFTCGEDGEFDGGDVLPGLRLPVRELFAD